MPEEGTAIVPNPIKTDDPIFAGIADQVPTAFLRDVVALINRSPTLLSQINQLDSLQLPGGGTARIALQTGADNGASSSYRSAVINISALSSYDDSQLIAEGGSTTPGQTELITPAGVFVGLLGYEMAHWTDAQLGPLYSGGLGGYTLEQAVATEFLSEGKSGDNQYAILSQVQQSETANSAPPSMANGNILFNITSNPEQDTQLLGQVAALQGQPDAYAKAISTLGSQFWNVPVDGGSFLSTMWNSYEAGGAHDDLGISLSHITGFAVSGSESGALAGCTIQTHASGGPALTYQITTPKTGQQQAQVSDASTHAPLATISTTIDAAGAMQLALAANSFSFGVAASASLAVNGNGDTVIGAGGNSIALAGGDALVCAGAGNTTVTGADSTTTVFGGAGDVDYAGGGGILVMGSGSATVAGGAGETVFGGGGHVSYQGGQDYADVIGGSGSCTIHAGAGGGWYGGGSRGQNALLATGAGTVLDAGGNGDTLTGAAGGGAYLIAAAGNETLLGGNQSGTTSFFLGSGADLVNAGAGGSVINTGTGTATIQGGGGLDQVWGGSGGADLFIADDGGRLEVHGFRTGVDHLGAGAQQVSVAAPSAAGTLFTLSSGATILLADVEAGAGSAFS